MSKTFREASRLDFSRDKGATFDDLRIGCLQRIADATEAMSRRHVELINERDKYKGWYEMEKAARQSAERQVAALRGVITRMKRKNP